MFTWIFVLSVLLLSGTLTCSAGNQESCVGGYQDVNETEEHTNISLTCSYPTDKPLHIVLQSLNPLRIIYQYDRKFNPEPYTHESFRDRLACDFHLARTGQIRCVLEDLRLSDAGTYHLLVDADGKLFSGTFELRVTAAADQLQTHTPTWTPQPEEQTQRHYYVTLGAVLVCVVVVMVLIVFCIKNKRRQNSHVMMGDIQDVEYLRNI